MRGLCDDVRAHPLAHGGDRGDPELVLPVLDQLVHGHPVDIGETTELGMGTAVTLESPAKVQSSIKRRLLHISVGFLASSRGVGLKNIH